MKRLLLFLLLPAALRAAEVLSLQTATPVTTPPVLDGKLDDSAWKEIPKVGTFYAFFSGVPRPAASKTDYQIGYDKTGVYLAIRFHDPQMDKIKASITTRGDGALWTDDSAEVYLDPDGAGIGFRKFMVNSLGTQSGALQLDAANVDQTWNPDGWKVATGKDAEGWTAEFFFPTSVLGRTAEPGDLWRYAITRFAYAGKGLHAASSPGAKFFNPENFGWLYFLKSAKPDALALGIEIKSRMPGDWILPLGAEAVAKQGDKIEVVKLSEPVDTGKAKAVVALAECRKLPASAEVAATLDGIVEKLAAIPEGVTDPADFANAMLDLAAVDKSIEDYAFSQKLKALVEKNAPAPLPTPAPKEKKVPKPKVEKEEKPAKPAVKKDEKRDAAPEAPPQADSTAWRCSNWARTSASTSEGSMLCSRHWKS